MWSGTRSAQGGLGFRQVRPHVLAARQASEIGVVGGLETCFVWGISCFVRLADVWRARCWAASVWAATRGDPRPARLGIYLISLFRLSAFRLPALARA